MLGVESEEPKLQTMDPGPDGFTGMHARCACFKTPAGLRALGDVFAAMTGGTKPGRIGLFWPFLKLPDPISPLT